MAAVRKVIVLSSDEEKDHEASDPIQSAEEDSPRRRPKAGAPVSSSSSSSSSSRSKPQAKALGGGGGGGLFSDSESSELEIDLRTIAPGHSRKASKGSAASTKRRSASASSAGKKASAASSSSSSAAKAAAAKRRRVVLDSSGDEDEAGDGQIDSDFSDDVGAADKKGAKPPRKPAGKRANSAARNPPAKPKPRNDGFDSDGLDDGLLSDPILDEEDPGAVVSKPRRRRVREADVELFDEEEEAEFARRKQQRLMRQNQRLRLISSEDEASEGAGEGAGNAEGDDDGEDDVEDDEGDDVDLDPAQLARLQQQEELAKAMRFVTARILEQELDGMDLSPALLTSISATVFGLATHMGCELVAFAEHAKRARINMQDTLLLTRRNASLRKKLLEFMDAAGIPQEGTGGGSRAGGGRKKKSDG